MPPNSPPDNDPTVASSKHCESLQAARRPALFRTEDWWAIWLGGAILLTALAATWLARPADQDERIEQYQTLTAQYDALAADPSVSSETIKAVQVKRDDARKAIAVNPLAGYVAKLGSWDADPSRAFVDKKEKSLAPGLLGAALLCLVIFAIGVAGLGHPWKGFPLAFVAVFLLAILAFVLAGQNVIKHYNLEYALWALVVGLLISNTIGTPRFMLPAVRTEFYIKTGLVLLGAEILFSRLLSLGVPGICVSWVVTPVVLISTYVFGQRVLKMQSRSLNMVISADMSVCGVSAAIATGAACRAKREELSLAIALSLGFTVVMMVVMPPAIRAMGLSDVVGGAWIGGSIDSTGAVAAAGNMLGDTALAVAATVKMIQNILIGAVAFAVSIYWVGWVERTPGAQRVGLGEIWRRFPKFMLGFLAASLTFSLVSGSSIAGQATVNAVLTGTTETLRGWLFCLAFVSIGLETNFRELRPYFHGGKPLVLYVCGQTLNLLLSLAMAWLMFEKVFPHAATALGSAR